MCILGHELPFSYNLLHRRKILGISKNLAALALKSQQEKLSAKFEQEKKEAEGAKKKLLEEKLALEEKAKSIEEESKESKAAKTKLEEEIEKLRQVSTLHSLIVAGLLLPTIRRPKLKQSDSCSKRNMITRCNFGMQCIELKKERCCLACVDIASPSVQLLSS